MDDKKDKAPLLDPGQRAVLLEVAMNLHSNCQGETLEWEALEADDPILTIESPAIEPLAVTIATISGSGKVNPLGGSYIIPACGCAIELTLTIARSHDRGYHVTLKGNRARGGGLVLPIQEFSANTQLDHVTDAAEPREGEASDER